MVRYKTKSSLQDPYWHFYMYLTIFGHINDNL